MKIDRAQIEKKTLLKLIDFKEKRVLEIGCSYGRFTEYYFEKALSVTGIDPDGNCIISAQKNQNLKGGKFIVGNFLDYNFSEKFEVILFSMSLHHLENYELALEKAFELLAENGKILIIEPTINEYLNVIMSMFDDENKQINDAYSGILKFRKNIKYSEIFSIRWEFKNIEEVINYLKWDNDLKTIEENKCSNIKDFLKKFEQSSGKIVIIDFIRFVLLER